MNRRRKSLGLAGMAAVLLLLPALSAGAADGEESYPRQRGERLNRADDPSYNRELNPDYNRTLNPNYNREINPNFNRDIHPNFTRRLHPDYNKKINLVSLHKFVY